MRHLARLIFICVTVLRYGLDELALSHFRQRSIRLLGQLGFRPATAIEVAERRLSATERLFVLERPWTLVPSTRSMLSALTLAIACTGGALLLYFRLLRTIGPLGVASNSYLRAGVSVALGVAILGEAFTWPIAAGGAAIIAGVVLINAPERPPPRVAEGAGLRRR